MTIVPAIFENGVFRPTVPVDLPENSEVELELRTRGDRGMEFDPSARPIEEVIAEIVAEVPAEAWKSLPDDLLDNLDHYLYSTPKQ